MYNSQLKKVGREQTDGKKFAEFRNRVRALCDAAPDSSCAPFLAREIDRLHREIFGEGIDYLREKSLFNGLLLGMEERLAARIFAADDPLCEGLKYAMASNYIDFARLADLNAGAVDTVIAAAERATVDKRTLEAFRGKLTSAKTLCFLHDNCGEIVLDKILIVVIRRLYPQISVVSVVRGAPILNDVTEEDARAVGLDKFARVVGNGTDVPGTPLGEINAETKELLFRSDVVLSKGLGNLETLYGEIPAFYCFCCKCEHIARRFGAPLWSSVFARSS